MGYLLKYENIVLVFFLLLKNARKSFPPSSLDRLRQIATEFLLDRLKLDKINKEFSLKLQIEYKALFSTNKIPILSYFLIHSPEGSFEPVSFLDLLTYSSL
jgi:hypothetical protein